MPPHGLVIRPARFADQTPIRELAVGFRFGLTTFPRTDEPERQMEGHLIAVLSGRIVGWVAAKSLLDAPPPQFLVPWTLSMKLNALAVDPEFRREGIGGKLIVACAEVARNDGADSMWGMAQQGDDFVEARLKFFARCGLKPVPHANGTTDLPDFVGGSLTDIASAMGTSVS